LYRIHVISLTQIIAVNNKPGDIPKRCSFFAKIRKTERLGPLSDPLPDDPSPAGAIFGPGRFALKSLVKSGCLSCKVWQNYAKNRVVRSGAGF
jgi:hypothetical protein